MEYANIKKEKKIFVEMRSGDLTENKGLLKPTIENVFLIASIFLVGELLIAKSGIPVLEMGINHLILFLVIVLVATFKGYSDEKKRNILRGE